jgi:hypothetical protein
MGSFRTSSFVDTSILICEGISSRITEGFLLMAHGAVMRRIADRPECDSTRKLRRCANLAELMKVRWKWMKRLTQLEIHRPLSEGPDRQGIGAVDDGAF